MSPTVVQLRIWRVGTNRIPGALTRMATTRRPLAATPGLEFHKLLGTGSGRSFTTRDADLHHWALLTVFKSRDRAEDFDSSGVLRSWAGIAAETLTVELSPLASRGRWAGRDPFATAPPHRWRGPVAAITRARIRTSQWRRFWAAVPPVAADLRHRPELLLSLGIGEAPIGLQGTFSVWASNTALTAFAQRGSAHRDAMAETARRGWYSEELFARFAVTRTEGTFDGRTIPAGPGEST